MAVASDNVFPKLILLEGTTPASPSAGDQKLFIDSADHKAKRVNSSGLVTSLEDLVSTKAANYSIVASDNRTLFIANAASLVFTLPAPATAGAGFWIIVKNTNQTTTGIKTNTSGVLIDGVDCSSTAFTGGLTTSQGAVKLQTDGTAWYSVAMDSVSGGGGGGSGLYSAYLCYQDQKASGTNGGTFTSGAWRTRDLNTEVVDTGNFGSVASNQITLAAGTYDVWISVPANKASNHQGRLQNITGSTTLIAGTSEIATGSTNAQSRSLIVGRITLAGSTVLEVQHQCALTEATDGMGAAAGFTTEVYTVAQFFKV